MVEYSDPRDFGFRPETVMTALMPYEQYSSKTRRLILGIDMGIASVGVCLIDIRNHEIILMASHIFKAPVEGKQKDISARQSGASIRRGYRSVRRTTKRRKNRKKAVRDIEKKYVLIPDDADGQWFAIRKGEPDVLHLRGKALLYKLNGRELARILYAFAGRRGYIDHSHVRTPRFALKYIRLRTASQTLIRPKTSIESGKSFKLKSTIRDLKSTLL